MSGSPSPSESDGSFWEGRRVVVTGHTGFKGAWLTLWLTALGAEVTGVALPPERENGIFSVLSPWHDLTSHYIDVRDHVRITSVFVKARPEVVFHLAAQPLVSRGIQQPVETYDVNVVGTAAVLAAADASRTVRSIVVTTTDKVYGEGRRGHRFNESDPLLGSDPYSASKVCCEYVVSSWRAVRHESDAAAMTVRAGNVIGGGDHTSGRLVPDIVAALMKGESVELRHPDATRPWQFVLDPLLGYLQAAKELAHGRPMPPALNFGPENTVTHPVSEVTERAIQAWGDGEWEPATSTKYHEAASLGLDPTLAAATLGWSPRLRFEDAIDWTTKWYKAQSEGADMREFSIEQLDAYTGLHPMKG